AAWRIERCEAPCGIANISLGVAEYFHAVRKLNEGGITRNRACVIDAGSECLSGRDWRWKAGRGWHVERRNPPAGVLHKAKLRAFAIIKYIVPCDRSPVVNS